MSCPKYLKKGSCREAKASVLLSLLVVHNKRYSTFRCCRHFIYFACKVSKNPHSSKSGPQNLLKSAT